MSSMVLDNLAVQFIKISVTDQTPKAKDYLEPNSALRPFNVIFLPVNYLYEENVPYDYERLSVNMHILLLVSQHVSGNDVEPAKRVEVVLWILTSKVDVSSDAELFSKVPRLPVR